MSILAYLIPVALGLGALGLGAFIWAAKSGQFDDPDGASYRILDDETDRPLIDKIEPADRRGE